MNCRNFWSTLPEMRVLDDVLSAPHRQHLASCPSCAVAFEQQVDLTERLREVSSEYRREGAPPQIETRLLAQFRQECKDMGATPPVPAVHHMPFLPWAAAAVLLLTAATLLTQFNRPGPIPPAAQLTAFDAGEPEVSESGFVSLPNAGQIGTDDDMDLVRVEVPRSAMIGAGFAVSADRAAERVEADVLLGPDGLPRAVRFLN